MKSMKESLLPEPVEGLNFVDSPGDLPVLQVFAAKQVRRGGEVVWIDTGNRSSTYELAARMSEAGMEKVKIGRAFTPFQHHSLVRQLERSISPKTEMLVFSNLPRMYTSDQLGSEEAQELFLETWERIIEIQESRGLKVIITTGDDPLRPFIRENVDDVINVERNSQGIRYRSDNFRTEFYARNGSYQTTIPLWRKKERKKEVEA